MSARSQGSERMFARAVSSEVGSPATWAQDCVLPPSACWNAVRNACPHPDLAHAVTLRPVVPWAQDALDGSTREPHPLLMRWRGPGRAGGQPPSPGSTRNAHLRRPDARPDERCVARSRARAASCRWTVCSSVGDDTLRSTHHRRGRPGRPGATGSGARHAAAPPRWYRAGASAYAAGCPGARTRRVAGSGAGECQAKTDPGIGSHP